MKLGYLALGASCVLLTSCGGHLTMVGFGKDGKSVTANVDEKRYAEELSKALLRVEESVLPALREAKPDANDDAWKLRTAVVGFGVKAEAGIGPFKVAFRPRIRAAFANGDKPPIP